MPGSKLLSLKPEAGCCCEEPYTAKRNWDFVARRWQCKEQDTAKEHETVFDDTGSWDLEGLARRASTHGLTISTMAFQDAFIQTWRDCAIAACMFMTVKKWSHSAPTIYWDLDKDFKQNGNRSNSRISHRKLASIKT
ncbi:MAG: hypothetical protein FWG10_13850 [Eubacteriaceae bacterium]|nr:hypothetical protein [Eubacteriaceae bacterium]